MDSKKPSDCENCEHLRTELDYLRTMWERKTGQSEMWDDLRAARAERDAAVAATIASDALLKRERRCLAKAEGLLREAREALGPCECEEMGKRGVCENCSALVRIDTFLSGGGPGEVGDE